VRYDELGPEAVIRVRDAATGMRGVLVVDNSFFGPAGGGTRMAPDVTEDEVADLARAMTYKYAINGLPTGGAKAGIMGDPGMPAERKAAVLRAFGRALAPMLRSADEGWLLGVGPDMGIGDRDVDTIYEGAERPNINPHFTGPIGDDDPDDLTGFGVVVAARAALAARKRTLAGATFAIEGFGHAGVGVARYATREGAKIVAITTIRGGVHDPAGIDVAKMFELRRQHGDDCVLRYGRGEPLHPSDVYYLPADVLVPGARTYVIDARNQHRIQARMICAAGNIPLTEDAEELLHQRGTVVVPDFVANAGGTISVWTAILGGSPAQAFAACDKLITASTTKVLADAEAQQLSPPVAARRRVRAQILGNTARRIPLAEAKAIARTAFGW
jgi:glutamate dehydrogenase (NAD(P)+)